MFEIQDLSLSYRLQQEIGTSEKSLGEEVRILKNLNFKVDAGEFVGIQGPSGSGKSTLFYILGFLLKPNSGKIIFDGLEITCFSEDELTLIRNQKIGFIFQQFHLLARANALDNILLPSRYPSEFAKPGLKSQEKALTLAKRLGMSEHLKHFPNQLSGGQQQRIAIARALMNDVDLILADEPTGNLDSQNAKEVLDLLSMLHREGKTIVLITHDPEVAKRCSKVYHLKDGAFTQVVDQPRSGQSPDVTREFQATAKKALSLKVKIPSVYKMSHYRRIFQSVFPLACENILRNKAKSLLTILGVVIGVAAVLVTVTLGQFTKMKILETYEALGVNKLLVRGYPNWHMRATDAVAVNFSEFNWEKEIKPLPLIFPEILAISPVLNSWGNRAMAGGIEAGDSKVSSIGVTPEYLAINQRSLAAGRNISPFHIDSRSPVCLIGFNIATRLFQRVNPLKQVITITDGRRISYPCEVIGVLNSVTSNSEWSVPNLNVLLPYTYFQSVADGDWNSKIHEIVMRIRSHADIEMTGKKIKSYFEQKYGKSGEFNTDTDSTLIAQMKKFLNIFEILLASIALLTLIVGGIGINNMMLVSVTERIREFGIRKALGATRISIRIQVLVESISLCMGAGFFGILLGFSSYELLILAATRFVPHLQFEWVFEPLAVFLSLFSILAVGIASGFIPAVRAERLQIVEALRSE